MWNNIPEDLGRWEERGGAAVAWAEAPEDLTDEIGVVTDIQEAPAKFEEVEQEAPKVKSRRILGRSVLLMVLGLALLWGVIGAQNFILNAFGVHAIYGWGSLGLVGALVILLSILMVREAWGYMRRGRFERLRKAARELEEHPRDSRLNAEVRWELLRFIDKMIEGGDGEIVCDCRAIKGKFDLADDAHEWKRHVDRFLLERLDRKAAKAIKQEALYVGMGTAGSPRGFLDGMIALWRNITLVRRIAEIYQVRAGAYGTWVLIKRSFTAAALALLAQESASVVFRNVGLGLLRLLGPMFQGVANAALTMHVGLEAQDLCRPLALGADQKRSVYRQTIKYLGESMKAVRPRLGGTQDG